VQGIVVVKVIELGLGLRLIGEMPWRIEELRRKMKEWWNPEMDGADG
jgi:hypothetical protein